MSNHNPFKFGSIVDEPYFTNRKDEMKQITRLLQSRNHLILISPRRYGKTSLMMKVAGQTDRPFIWLDLQLVTDVPDLAAQLMKRIYRIYPFGRLRQLVKNFRIVPTLSMNPVNNSVEISFQSVSSALLLLEDVFNLLESLGSKGKRLVVILDEFQDINRIGGELDRQMRAIIQHHQHVNYAFLGSMESMMREIFEKKKSPFYHFGQLIPLGKIPESEFKAFLINGLSARYPFGELLSDEILRFTQGHPYYTQQLAFTLWESEENSLPVDQTMNRAVNRIINIHDMDYERLWLTQNQTDKKILIAVAVKEQNILSDAFNRKYGIVATSTVFSSLKRLAKQGYINKTGSEYEMDDPFFANWIIRKRAA